MKIEIADKNDLHSLLKLYTELHDNTMPNIDENILTLWDNILSDKNHRIVVGKIDNEIISSCVLVIVPNLTHNQRPYALIENVITAKKHRGKGYALQILNFAKGKALVENCYKIMLLTGSKEESTLSFYRKAGYNSEDKTGFVMWLW